MAHLKRPGTGSWDVLFARHLGDDAVQFVLVSSLQISFLTVCCLTADLGGLESITLVGNKHVSLTMRAPSGSSWAHNFGRPDRRKMLAQSALGIGAMGLSHLLADDGRLRAEDAASTLAVRSPHFPAKAKRVIHFFLNGGPSHVDTFDPKPALKNYVNRSVSENLLTERKTGAGFPSPFRFRRYGQSGIEVSEIFEKTAQHIDDIAVIRSMYAQVPNHEPSLMLMNCGDSVQPRPRSEERRVGK